MTQASIGFHCPNCAAKGATKVLQGRQAFASAFKPSLTYALIAVNVAVFLVTISKGDQSSLIDFGANGFAVSERGEWYRIVTSAFLHWNIIHIAFNMLALWNIGPIVERSLGRLNFGVIYAASLMGGSAGALFVSPDAITAGASGAIYGLLGALIIIFRRRGINIWQSGLGITLALNFFITVSLPNVSLGGHVGGLIGGFAATWIAVEGPRVLGSAKNALGAAVALVPALFVFALFAATTWKNPLF